LLAPKTPVLIFSVFLQLSFSEGDSLQLSKWDWEKPIGSGFGLSYQPENIEFSIGFQTFHSKNNGNVFFLSVSPFSFSSPVISNQREYSLNPLFFIFPTCLLFIRTDDPKNIGYTYFNYPLLESVILLPQLLTNWAMNIRILEFGTYAFLGQKTDYFATQSWLSTQTKIGLHQSIWKYHFGAYLSYPWPKDPRKFMAYGLNILTIDFTP